MGLKIEYRKNKGGVRPRPVVKSEKRYEEGYKRRRKMGASIRAKGKSNPDPTW